MNDKKDLVDSATLLQDTLEKYIHASMPYMSRYRYPEIRTLEDVEKDLVELKKSSEEEVEYSELSHEISSMQYLLMCLGRDMAMTQRQITALDTSGLPISDEKSVSMILLRARLESYADDINTLRARYRTLVEELKQKRFHLASDKLRKEKEELLEEAAKNPPPEGQSDEVVDNQT